MEVYGFLNIKAASFVVDTFEDVVDKVVHSSHSVEPLSHSGRGEFVVGIETCSLWIKAIENSICGEFVGSGGCSVVDTICKRYLCLLAVLSGMTVDPEVLLACLDCLFTESIYL